MVSTEYIPLAERDKVLFDLKGYLLFPAVLSAEEIAPIKEQCEKMRQDKESLPPAERKLPGGAASLLIDHPAVMRVLHQVIDDETEKLRCESCFVSAIATAMTGTRGGIRTPAASRLIPISVTSITTARYTRA